jgi:endonuclease/exonuclease/phosphatase family metal-dependent hydrolase
VELKILSFNIWDLPLFFVKNRKARIKGTAEYLKKLDADIICLQESFDTKHRFYLRDQLTDSYYMAGDTEETKRLLFWKFLDMSGGLVIFSKFPILSSEFVSYSRVFNSAVGEVLARKGFLEAIIKTTKGKVRILNTHLHEETQLFDRSVRLSQLAKLFGLLKQDNLPTILTGDFNEEALMHQEKFSALFDSRGFKHPIRAVRPSDVAPTYRPGNPYVDNWVNRTSFPKRFDYILIKNMEKLGLETTRYEPQIITPPLSDHDPVLLVLSDGKTL